MRPPVEEERRCGPDVTGRPARRARTDAPSGSTAAGGRWCAARRGCGGPSASDTEQIIVRPFAHHIALLPAPGDGIGLLDVVQQPVRQLHRHEEQDDQRHFRREDRHAGSGVPRAGRPSQQEPAGEVAGHQQRQRHAIAGPVRRQRRREHSSICAGAMLMSVVTASSSGVQLIQMAAAHADVTSSSHDMQTAGSVSVRRTAMAAPAFLHPPIERARRPWTPRRARAARRRCAPARPAARHVSTIGRNSACAPQPNFCTNVSL